MTFINLAEKFGGLLSDTESKSQLIHLVDDIGRPDHPTPQMLQKNGGSACCAPNPSQMPQKNQLD